MTKTGTGCRGAACRWTDIRQPTSGWKQARELSIACGGSCAFTQRTSTVRWGAAEEARRSETDSPRSPGSLPGRGGWGFRRRRLGRLVPEAGGAGGGAGQRRRAGAGQCAVVGSRGRVPDSGRCRGRCRTAGGPGAVPAAGWSGRCGAGGAGQRGAGAGQRAVPDRGLVPDSAEIGLGQRECRLRAGAAAGAGHRQARAAADRAAPARDPNGVAAPVREREPQGRRRVAR